MLEGVRLDVVAPPEVPEGRRSAFPEVLVPEVLGVLEGRHLEALVVLEGRQLEALECRNLETLKAPEALEACPLGCWRKGRSRSRSDRP